MKQYAITTLANARAAQAQIDAALRHPSRGEHIGGGRHVDADDGNRIGWTLSECEVIRADDGSVCLLLTERAAAIAPAGLTLLPASTLPAKFAAGRGVLDSRHG